MSDLNWISVEIEGLPKGLQQQFAAIVEHRAVVRQLTDEFEVAFLADLAKNGKPEARAALKSGKELKFGYRFGGLGVAFADPAPKKSKKVSLF